MATSSTKSTPTSTHAARAKVVSLPVESVVAKIVVSERDFTAQVIALAQLNGFRVAHFRPAMTAKGWRTPVQGDGAGFPDLVLVRGCRLIFAELKATKGRVSPDQTEWLARLMGAGAECYIWRPDDWDEIVAKLEPAQ